MSIYYWVIQFRVTVGVKIRVGVKVRVGVSYRALAIAAIGYSGS